MPPDAKTAKMVQEAYVAAVKILSEHLTRQFNPRRLVHQAKKIREGRMFRKLLSVHKNLLRLEPSEEFLLVGSFRKDIPSQRDRDFCDAFFKLNGVWRKVQTAANLT